MNIELTNNNHFQFCDSHVGKPNIKYQWVALGIFQKAGTWCKLMRKRLFTILKELKLKISPHKTRMGALKAGFHFLGVNFEVSQNPQSKTQLTTVDVHPRTCRRALDTVAVMQQDAVHPAKIQHYLSLWARWWHPVVRLEQNSLIYNWVCYVKMLHPELLWFGQGLLLGSSFYRALNLTINSTNPHQ